MYKRFPIIVVTTVAGILLTSDVATAQSDPPKLELGAQFSLMRQADTGVFGNFASGVPSEWDPGFGGRFSFNVMNQVALEAEMNFFPREKDFFDRGRKTQGLFGVKAGLRKERFGVFGKVRPGFMRFGRIFSCSGDDINTCGRFGRMEFALDLGGVVEFYPSNRAVLRFDIGDTVIKFRDTNVIVPFPEAPGGILRGTVQGRTTHNLQINVGVGIRF
jgi:hypothetical protein